ncbi:MAG: LAGLIDADG family homing endonuclease [Candidatus Nanoarchaeia archaeon]|nr:LAGLIDADG family homing endonuclease [Candidatus Nanoarchaeia archaeon]MDD5239826.1 LAGLIDADG family homing endonuclease [Candidatus Nanoarchaeia archaeon]
MAEIVIGRSERDVEKYGIEGTIFVGKQYVKMGETMSLANKILLDVVRPHVILVSGKRGEGKCIHGDTEIILSDGSIKTVKELANDENQIVALNQILKLKTAEKTKFYVREANELLEIKLRTGRTIKLTPEHPLLTVKGWENACNLNVGSRVATPRELNIFGTEFLEDSKVKILAYLIAEGHMSNNFVLFCNSDDKIVTDFKNSINEFDRNLLIKKHGHLNLRIVECKRHGHGIDSKSSIRKWLGEIGIYGKLSTEKFIPDSVFKLPKNKVALFLNRLFSCDGTIYPREETWDVSYSSSSKKLIMQVQHLLLRFGVVSVLKTKVTPRNLNYELIIRGAQIIRFLNEIGFFGVKELRAALALRELSSKKFNPNIDTVPKEIWEWYRPNNWAEIGRTMGYSTPKGLRSSINYAPNRQKLKQIALADKNEAALMLAESDIYWDEITEINRLSGKFTVYDISVPEHHNFVAADIIVHNSYTLAMIAEGISDLPKEISQNIAPLFLDTMGIFWTMKQPNFRDEALLTKWGLQPRGLTNVKVFVPGGKFDEMVEQGIPVDEKFYITTSEINADEWCYVMGINATSDEGVLIASVINRLNKKEERYGIKDIVKEVEKDEDSDKRIKAVVRTRFEAADAWGLFADEGTAVEQIIVGGQATVLDISAYAHVYGGFSIRALVVGLFAKKILEQRMAVRKIEEQEEIEKGFSYYTRRDVKKKRIPLVWMFIDEIHEFLPLDSETIATGPLLQVIREGRQPGISMIVATQQPGKMNTDVLSQCDLVISHRVTAKDDINALNRIMQTYLTSELREYFDELPRVQGTAVILDQNQERMYSVQMRPRFSWHGGETPTAIPPKERKI